MAPATATAARCPLPLPLSIARSQQQTSVASPPAALPHLPQAVRAKARLHTHHVGSLLAFKDICSRSKTYADVVVPTRTPHTHTRARASRHPHTRAHRLRNRRCDHSSSSTNTAEPSAPGGGRTCSVLWSTEDRLRQSKAQPEEHCPTSQATRGNQQCALWVVDVAFVLLTFYVILPPQAK